MAAALVDDLGKRPRASWWLYVSGARVEWSDLPPFIQARAADKGFGIGGQWTWTWR